MPVEGLQAAPDRPPTQLGIRAVRLADRDGSGSLVTEPRLVRETIQVRPKSPRGILINAMLPAPRHRYSFEEYLELEAMAGVRHEYFGGEIYAMAGGTPEHAAMAAAVTTILGRQLGSGPCRVYSSDLRIRVVATGLATYPDVTVVCGRSERDPNSKTHVTNPKLVVEVLSPATAEYDRGEKLEHYRQIPSLEAVVLIDHEGPRIELWTREPNGWQQKIFASGEIVPLDPIRGKLAVDEVYAAAQNA